MRIAYVEISETRARLEEAVRLASSRELLREDSSSDRRAVFRALCPNPANLSAKHLSARGGLRPLLDAAPKQTLRGTGIDC
jgi:hypothetical protein